MLLKHSNKWSYFGEIFGKQNYFSNPMHFFFHHLHENSYQKFLENWTIDSY